MFWLSVGLTTVLAPIFAVATTFLGRSLAAAREADLKEEEEARDAARATVESLQQALNTGSSRTAIAEAKKELDKASNYENTRRRKRWFRRAFQGPGLLSVAGIVVVPGMLFVLAATSSSLAKSLALINFDTSLLLGASALVGLCAGIWRLILALSEVQRVSMPSEQAYFRSQIDAHKQAQLELDEEKRPICVVGTEEDQPIQMIAGQEHTVNLMIRVRINAAHNVILWLYAPPEFKLLDPFGTPNSAADSVYPAWNRAVLPTSDFILVSVTSYKRIKICAPQDPGPYRFGYAIASEEFSLDTFDSRENEIQIEVVAASPDPAVPSSLCVPLDAAPPESN